MQSSPGTFIVIEGADGSGKKTQFNLLAQRLTAVGYDVATFDFPRYDEPSSHFVKNYLAGNYGPSMDISPYAASIFYALDRYEASGAIKKALAAGKVVLANRYVTANMAHQGSKIEDPLQQRSFFIWEDSLEYQLLGIPRPSINIFLRVPPEVSHKLIIDRARRTKVALDEHEKDTFHLKRSAKTYDLLCKLFPKDFVAIDCIEKDNLLDIPTISNKVWEAIKPYLPVTKPKPPKPMTVRLEQAEGRPENVRKDDRAGKQLTAKISLAMVAEVEAVEGVRVDYKPDWRLTDYQFYIPAGLPKKLATKYGQLMKDIVSDYKKIAKSSERQLASRLMPLGALVDTTMRCPAEVQERLRAELSRSRNQEATDLLNILGKPSFQAERETNRQERQNSPKDAELESVNDILTRLVSEHLPQNLPPPNSNLQLLEATPRSEFKVLTDIAYGFSALSKSQIDSEIDKWDYDQKRTTLETALKAGSPGLGAISYKFDVVCNRLSLDKLQNARLFSKVILQPPTPRYGYDVPEGIEEAGNDEAWVSAFDKSLELFSALQASDNESLAVYGVLMGHKLRAQVTVAIDGISRTLSSKEISTPERTLVLAIKEQIALAHPIIGSWLDSARNEAPKPARQRRHRKRSHRTRS